ncbi:MAG TPA: PorV/PorQ family protein [Bacteroidota bacterium]
MTKRILYTALMVCVVLGVVVDSVSAQNKRTGTAAATELLIPVGGRDLALGGSTIATSTGLEAIYWNPAGLGRMTSSAEGMFSSMTWIADIGVTYGAVGAQFGDIGVVALSVKSIDFGDIPLTTNDDPENISGRFYSPTYVTVGLSYARALTDAISAGGSLKLVNEQIERVSSSGVALDFGVQYRGLVGVSGLNLGVAVKNIGPQMQYEGSGLYRDALARDGNRPTQKYKSETATFELPSTVEIGLGYSGTASDNMVWSVTSSFTNNNLYLDEYRVGGEIGVMMQELRLFGRVGVGMVPQAEENADIFGSTFGFGLGYLTGGLDLSVDYAYRQVEFFDANQVISIKVGF